MNFRLLFLLFFFNCAFLNAQDWNTTISYPGGAIDDGVGFSVGKIGFVGTGRDAGFQYRNDFYKFENNFWEPIAPVIGTPRQYTTSFSFAHSGCVLTGIAPNDSLLNEIQCYDSQTNSWQIKNPFSGEPRLQATAFIIGEFGFCGGGRNLNESFDDWYKYDVKMDSWTRIADFPNSRNESVSFTINGIGYVGLGRNNNGVFYNSFFAYNPITNTWTPIADFPGNIMIYASGFSINNLGYVVTGVDDQLVQSNEFWQYDPVSDTWIQLDNFPFTPIRGTSVFCVNNCAHILTGLDNNNVRTDSHYTYCEPKKEQPDFLLYPNPAKDNFVIYFQEHKENCSMQIYNVLGQEVLSNITITSYETISVSSLPVGTYILKVNYDNQSKLRKLIVY